MRNGQATISERLNVALFLSHYGWSWEQYINAPSWLVDLLDMKIVEDAKLQSSKKREK